MILSQPGVSREAAIAVSRSLSLKSFEQRELLPGSSRVETKIVCLWISFEPASAVAMALLRFIAFAGAGSMKESGSANYFAMQNHNLKVSEALTNLIIIIIFL